MHADAQPRAVVGRRRLEAGRLGSRRAEVGQPAGLGSAPALATAGRCGAGGMAARPGSLQERATRGVRWAGGRGRQGGRARRVPAAGAAAAARAHLKMRLKRGFMGTCACVCQIKDVRMRGAPRQPGRGWWGRVGRNGCAFGCVRGAEGETHTLANVLLLQARGGISMACGGARAAPPPRQGWRCVRRALDSWACARRAGGAVAACRGAAARPSTWAGEMAPAAAPRRARAA
ncbi:MAG: hypothetical protein J3K34DRAFT_430642 [Monoraphidium minutum]|nr:MAG: hypothetical protein J3K34DRAFT_430642 [Monoraphidium minutum]